MINSYIGVTRGAWGRLQSPKNFLKPFQNVWVNVCQYVPKNILLVLTINFIFARNVKKYNVSYKRIHQYKQ